MNGLNVSDDDAAGYEIDKAVVVTLKTDDALTKTLNKYIKKETALY